MNEEELKQSLNELADISAEQVRGGLAEDIKQRIGHGFVRGHHDRMDTVNVMIDLRISKLTAAAAIILVIVLCVSFLSARDSASGGMLKDTKMMVKYFLGDPTKSNILAGKLKYEYLAHQGEDIAFYGDSIDPDESNAVMVQWRLGNGQYRVIFGDLREETVTSDELIKLQAQMLRNKAK